jgi:hypothetical protein
MMHPRLEELLAYVDLEYRALQARVQAVEPVRRTQRPGSDRWSVAEIVDHVAIVEGRIAGRILTAVQAARAEGIAADPAMTPIIPTLELQRVAVRTEAIVAPQATTPVGVESIDAALAHLRRSHEELVTAIRQCDGVNLALLTMPHPLFGALTLYHWIGFSGAHTHRHTAQIEDVDVALARMGA